MRHLMLLPLLALAACMPNPIEGTYHTDDGEGSRATMVLRSGDVQFWQGDTDQPPLTGHYRAEGDKVELTIAGQPMALVFKDNCLSPVDDPSQPICKQ